jgi:hypothetical protein
MEGASSSERQAHLRLVDAFLYTFTRLVAFSTITHLEKFPLCIDLPSPTQKIIKYLLGFGMY